MTLDKKTIEGLAEMLENAELEARAVEMVTSQHPNMDLEDAYAVQYAIRARKHKRGHALAGLKMGLTSSAKMKQMNVDQPIYGFLPDCGNVEEGATVELERLIHPRVEPEIGIMTKHALKGPGCHLGQALVATDFVVPALEIIDSRYRDFRFDLPSVVADNTSAARFVVGGRMERPEVLDLRALGVVMEKNGEIVETGASAAVLGHPLASLVRLVNLLAVRGEEVPAGTFVLTGGIVTAVPVASGDCVRARFQHLGPVGVKFR